MSMTLNSMAKTNEDMRNKFNDTQKQQQQSLIPYSNKKNKYYLHMKKIKVSFVILLFFSLWQNASAQRVVILGLDGFSAEAFNKIKHPHIDQLFAQGVISVTTRPVMPSITLPNWTQPLNRIWTRGTRHYRQ